MLLMTIGGGVILLALVVALVGGAIEWIEETRAYNRKFKN